MVLIACSAIFDERWYALEKEREMFKSEQKVLSSALRKLLPLSHLMEDGTPSSVIISSSKRMVLLAERVRLLNNNKSIKSVVHQQVVCALEFKIVQS